MCTRPQTIRSAWRAQTARTAHRLTLWRWLAYLPGIIIDIRKPDDGSIPIEYPED